MSRGGILDGEEVDICRIDEVFVWLNETTYVFLGSYLYLPLFLPTLA